MDEAGARGGAARAEDRAPLAARWPAFPFAVTVVGAFLAAVVVSTLVSVALGTGRRAAADRAPEEILAIALLSDGALLLAILALGRRLLGVRLADLGFRAPPPGALAFAVRVAAGLWLLSIAVNAVQIRALGPHPQSLVVSVGAHSGPLAIAMDLLTGAAIAPLAEETLFRGLLFAGLAQRMPATAAGAASALLFALSHGLDVALPIFALGLGLAWVYARTGTIWAPIATHALVNAVSLVLVFLLPRQ